MTTTVTPKQIALPYGGQGDLKSTRVAARRIGRSIETVRRYCEMGVLRGYQAFPGARLQVSMRSVDEYLERMRRQLEQLDPKPEKGE